MELAPDLDSYQEEKNHSEAVDAWLGLNISEVESKLKKIEGQEIWTKVPVSTMLTPYSEIKKILQELNPQPDDLVVDLGAGYGRMGFVIEKYFPGVKFCGLELVAERVQEGNRALKKFGACRSQLEVFDLALQIPPRAPFYFVYDFGTDQAIGKLFCALRDFHAPITVAARGRGVRDCIEKKHPWLGEVIAPKHFPHFSVYKNR